MPIYTDFLLTQWDMPRELEVQRSVHNLPGEATSSRLLSSLLLSVYRQRTASFHRESQW